MKIAMQGHAALEAYGQHQQKAENIVNGFWDRQVRAQGSRDQSKQEEHHDGVGHESNVPVNRHRGDRITDRSCATPTGKRGRALFGNGGFIDTENAVITIAGGICVDNFYSH